MLPVLLQNVDRSTCPASWIVQTARPVLLSGSNPGEFWPEQEYWIQMDFGLNLMPKGTIWMINCYFFTCKNGYKDSLGRIRDKVDILGIIQYILKIPECLGFIFFHFGGREGSTRYWTPSLICTRQAFYPLSCISGHICFYFILKDKISLSCPG